MEHFETRSKKGRKHGHAGRGMAQRSLDLIEARYRHDDKWDCHGAQAPPSDAPADNLDDIPDFLLRSKRVPAI